MNKLKEKEEIYCQKMQKSLTGRDRNLRRWTASLLAKLAEMTDAEYEALELYPDE